MSCRNEYLNETALDIASRIVAAHLVYVFTKLKQESHITSEMTKASTAYYGNVKMVDEWTALLCATLTGLSETNIDAIVYNARDACSRSLADWWERHQAWDKKRARRWPLSSSPAAPSLFSLCGPMGRRDATRT